MQARPRRRRYGMQRKKGRRRSRLAPATPGTGGMAPARFPHRPPGIAGFATTGAIRRCLNIAVKKPAADDGRSRDRGMWGRHHPIRTACFRQSVPSPRRAGNPGPDCVKFDASAIASARHSDRAIRNGSLVCEVW